MLPDKASSSGFLSPALFPLYKDEAEPQILPIPKITIEIEMAVKCEIVVSVVQEKFSVNSRVYLFESFSWVTLIGQVSHWYKNSDLSGRKSHREGNISDPTLRVIRPLCPYVYVAFTPCKTRFAA
ncbi:hypothetical protein KIN20_030590 [Parelaphostrongylus tenuis]|uniref:Uncharacterized protein n=1 Tax=Parelaphostrongylus tenuis TaxID=148309 RepID=A0AAD5WG83_PARTN|nr:hypothetical protein KIN20_030590 [Parelaphostrongylus tenuis]